MTITSSDLIVIITLLIILIDTLYLIYYLNKQNAPMRTTVVQYLGVVLFVPLIFLLSFTGKIEENTLSTLMGAFVGYVFGKASLPQEWGGK